MTEKLFQFIWQFQYFNQHGLHTTQNEPVQIIFPGKNNTNQGPDFIDARVRIGSTGWAGTIELHLKTSDWKKHGHDTDTHYRNVILHVVWENDLDNSAIPLIELKGRIPGLLLQRYEDLMNTRSFIPCNASISHMPEINWQIWKDLLVVERLTRKSISIKLYLQENNQHWEETFWWMLARNFGVSINGDAFEELARSLTITILGRERINIQHMEALLFGQAGLLNKQFAEEYPRLLQNEYLHLKRKYQLIPIPIPMLFLRMRPGNFPSIRLAQLSSLILLSGNLFSLARTTDSLPEFRQLLSVSASNYWNTHYRFDEVSAFREKKLGQGMIDNILINTIIPVLFCYGLHLKDDDCCEKALNWLQLIHPESNSIIQGFRGLGIKCRNGWDSQALLELKNEYCNKKRCLDCSVGKTLLGQAAPTNN